MLFWCAGVTALFATARWLSGRIGHPPWASPVLVTAIAIGSGLAISGIPVAAFEAQMVPLRWLLGPAVVAMAVIVEGNRELLRADSVPVLVAVIGGALTGIACATGLAMLLGLDRILVQALLVKTVTAPFVVSIMTALGGPVGLAAALSVLTGVIGALAVPLMLDRLRVGGAARGLAIGVSSHIVGTDWLTRRDPRAGGLAALALVLTGLVAAVVVPLAWRFL